MRIDAHSCALGKAMLAYKSHEELKEIYKSYSLYRHTANTITSLDKLYAELRKIRNLGYSVNEAETFNYVYGIGAPILDSQNRAIAAISLSGTRGTVNVKIYPSFGKKSNGYFQGRYPQNYWKFTDKIIYMLQPLKQFLSPDYFHKLNLHLHKSDDMTIPKKIDYLIIGAGIHGLSTALHLAKKLKALGKGDGSKILVVDKGSIASGASGVACGVVRNNYFQPAMRELMAHSVEVWESDPETFHYHPVGYMQISPEVMEEDVASIHEQQRAIGYESTFVQGEKESSDYMKNIFSDWQAKRYYIGFARKKRWLRKQYIFNIWSCPKGRS